MEGVLSAPSKMGSLCGKTGQGVGWLPLAGVQQLPARCTHSRGRTDGRTLTWAGGVTSSDWKSWRRYCGVRQLCHHTLTWYLRTYHDEQGLSGQHSLPCRHRRTLTNSHVWLFSVSAHNTNLMHIYGRWRDNIIINNSIIQPL